MSKRAPLHSITHAAPPLSEDVYARTRRYLISMGIRTVCLVLAVVFTGWWRWGFLVLAIGLPYIAVVIANAGREPQRASDLPEPAVPRSKQPRAIKPPSN